MDYVGMICPYCRSEIKEDDEVVLCNVCEMPHHNQCWTENKGCTTFGCTGTIMGDYSTQFYDDNSNQAFKNEDIYNIDEEMKMIIYEKEEYYIRNFSKSTSWNWSSALWGSYWYAYRKMYLVQFIYWVIKIIPGAFILLFILSGIFGNSIYKNRVEKCARISKSFEGDAKEKYICKNRGTNAIAVMIILAIKILLVVLAQNL